MVLEQAGKLGDGQAEGPALLGPTACDVGHQCRHLGEVGEGVASADHGASLGARLRPLNNPTSCPEVSDGQARLQILELGRGSRRKTHDEGNRPAPGPPDDNPEVYGGPAAARQHGDCERQCGKGQ